MKKEVLLAIAQGTEKNIKSEYDLNDLIQMLFKITIEAALKKQH